MPDRLDARTLLGVPVLPPPAATKGVLALRRGLRRLDQAMAPPGVRILEGLFGLIDNRALGLLVELGLPDRLDRPRTTAELAAGTATSPDGLHRLLRYCAGRGFLRCDRRGRWRANAVTGTLRPDHPNSWAGWVDFTASDWFWDAFRHTDETVRGGRSGIEVSTGVGFFEYVNRVRPAAGEAFNRAMAAGSTVQALALAETLDWSGTETVCDIGGGTGGAMEFLLRARPGLSGVLFDLPEVIASARPALAAGGDLAGRCRLEGGDFFASVPAGADRYLLLAVVHDWDDGEAAKILANVKVALAERPGARAVVVEPILADRPRGDFAEASDLLMMALATGRERTAAGLGSVFAAGGLHLERKIPLATGFTAFELT
jgi:hypothetical protein